MPDSHCHHRAQEPPSRPQSDLRAGERGRGVDGRRVVGGRPFGMFVIKGGKSVSRGHVRLKSPPSESHRYEIQPDTLDLPPLSHPSAGPRGNPAQGPKTTRKPSLVLGKKRASSLLEKKTLSRVGKEKAWSLAVEGAVVSSPRQRVAPFGTWAPVQWGVVSPVPLTI